MANYITLVLEVDGIIPELEVLLNQTSVNFDFDTVKNSHGHLCVNIHCEIKQSSILNLIVKNNTSVNLVEIIVDNIRFGLVTFLCITVNGQQQTQLSAPGQLKINLSTPIWQFWCEKMNGFNYKDYPLGSIN